MDPKSDILLDEKIKGTLYSLRVTQPDKQQAHFDLIMRGRWTWASTECTTLTEPEIRFSVTKILETIGDAISDTEAAELTNKVLSLFLPEFKREIKAPIPSPSPSVPQIDVTMDLQPILTILQKLEGNIEQLNSKMEEILQKIGELGNKIPQVEDKPEF
ncbi:MAG: hypothetical protein ACFFCQ_08615 [Promethearchaeota archaeon]